MMGPTAVLMCIVLGRERRGQNDRVGRAYRHYRVEMPPTRGRCARVWFDFLRKCNKKLTESLPGSSLNWPLACRWSLAIVIKPIRTASAAKEHYRNDLHNG